MAFSLAGKKAQPKVQQQEEQVQQHAAVTPAKPKAVFAEPTVDEADLISKVDRMVALDETLKPLKPVAKEFDDTKKFLCGVADADGEPDQPVEIGGSDGNKVVFSAKSDKQVVVDKAGLVAALKAKFIEANQGSAQKGMDALIEFLQIPLGECEKYLSKVELAKFVVKESATGPRKLTAVVKG